MAKLLFGPLPLALMLGNFPIKFGTQLDETSSSPSKRRW